MLHPLDLLAVQLMVLWLMWSLLLLLLLTQWLSLVPLSLGLLVVVTW
jgi:hypothetical protein